MTIDPATLDSRMRGEDAFRSTHCPVGKALEVVGTRSAMLIMREAFYGTTRFDDFAVGVGVTDAVVATRLRELTAAGLLERRPYRDPGQRTRHEYRLTPKGLDLLPAVLGLFEWGKRHLSDPGTAPRLSHAGCQAPVRVEVICAEGHEVPLDELRVTTPRRRPRTT